MNVRPSETGRPVISWAVHCIEGSVGRRECSCGRTQETSA